MSARKPAIVLKPTARRDVRAILLYTSEQWGIAQRDVYREAIDRAFAALSANPLIDRSRDEITPGLRSYGVQQHIIFHRLSGETVIVLRVLHQKMGAARHV